MVKDWYPMEEVIQYRQEHVLWLLRHIQALRANSYPEGPAGEYAINPFHLYLELTERLRQCGLDGLVLLARESLDMLEVDLGEFFNQSAKEIMERTQTALRYVSGKLRHDWGSITYQEFKRSVGLADEQTEAANINRAVREDDNTVSKMR
jgi:hypothetical protein